jgi:hypothetical protein
MAWDLEPSAMIAARSITLPPPRLGRERRATRTAMSSSVVVWVSALTYGP